LASGVNVGLKAKIYLSKKSGNEFRDFISLNFEDSQVLLNEINKQIKSES
jgi:hypothetical protein